LGLDRLAYLVHEITAQSLHVSIDISGRRPSWKILLSPIFRLIVIIVCGLLMEHGDLSTSRTVMLGVFIMLIMLVAIMPSLLIWPVASLLRQAQEKT